MIFTHRPEVRFALRFNHQGGRVFDPGQGIDDVLDIAITDGRIAKIQKDISTSEGDKHIVVKGEGRYIVPGLIDLHTHV